MCNNCKALDRAMVNKIGPMILAKMLAEGTDLPTTVENMRAELTEVAGEGTAVVAEINGWLNTAAARIVERMGAVRQIVALMPEVPDTIPTDTEPGA